MTREEDLRRLLNDAATEIPAGSAPIAELVREGRRSKNRRHIVQAASVAAAVAVIAVGAFIVGPSIGGSGNLATQPTTSPSGLAVPAGTRLVGMNGVAVAVPDDWSTNDTKCGQALSDTVDFTETTAMTDCLIHGSEEFSLLRAVPLTSEWGRVSAAFNNGQTVDLQGIPAERLPTRCEDSQSNTTVTCHGTLVVSSLNAVMNLTSPNREVVDAVLDSASSIPEGYTAVPDVTGLYLDSEVKSIVESAGLLWVNRCPDGHDCRFLPIEATDPAAGSVVPVGTTVRAVDGPDRTPIALTPTEHDLLGQWRAVGELEEQLDNAGLSGRSMIVSFSQSDEKFEWESADGCNSLAGRFEVSANGEFSTSHVTQTDMGCPSVERDVVTVPDVVIRASQVRLVDGELRLYKEDSLLATFERLEATTTPNTPPNTPTLQSENTPIPLSTSSWKPGDGGDGALIGGRIALSKDGCVYFKTVGPRYDVIWPAGYSADVSPDGVLTVRNPAGEPVGHEGTKISVGGGVSEDEGGIPDEVQRLLQCEVTDSIVIIQDVLPPLSAPTTPTDKPTTPTDDVRNVRLIRDFVDFAVQPSATTAAPLPFASHVQLGLSRDLRATLAKSAVPQASAWTLKAKYFRGALGRFSALESVQRHARETKSQSVSVPGSAFVVSVGDHPHCVSPPVPAPTGFENHQRVSVQPSNKSLDSCLEWFTVDLFLDEEGHIAAVTLDIWEP